MKNLTNNNLEIITLNKKNIKNFALERNILLKKATAKWVLFLDSDEKLNKPIKNIPTDFDSYYLLRKNYFLVQYVGTDKIIRLVKKGTGKFVRAVHEVWVPKTSHLSSVILSPVIIHNTADNLKEYINKINNYSSLHAIENLKEGKKSNLIKIIFFPVGKFFVTLYKSKTPVFSIMQSLHSFLSWTKLYFLQH